VAWSPWRAGLEPFVCDYALVAVSLSVMLMKWPLQACGVPPPPRGGQGFRLKLIDEYTIKHQYDKPDGRLVSCEFTLSDWLFRAIKAQKVLTLHPAYFRLRPVAQRHRTGRQ